MRLPKIAALVNQVFLVALLGGAQTAGALTFVDDYLDGPETCKRYTSSSKEYPFFIQVPIDYEARPPQAETPLYAWTREPFEASRPTVIFVSGGPGDTAHDTRLQLPGWNIVFFDQRGNSCSKPMTQALHRSRSFYSSMNTVRDIEEIRKHLGIDKISLYAVSYGTVVAHMYGHFFAAHTRAVVLEGTVYRSDKSLFDPDWRRYLLQTYFDNLPSATQERILELSNRQDLAKNWFSAVGLMMLYLDDFETSFNNFLEIILWDDAVAESTLPLFVRRDYQESEFGANEVMMGMIGCQEMSMNTAGLSLYSVFIGRTLVSDGINSLQRLLCRDLGFQPDEVNRTYDASQFPTFVPTTYFQGAKDGATVFPNAVDHFEKARKGFGQILIMTTGGHSPIHGPLASGYGERDHLVIYQRLLAQALAGEALDITELSSIRSLELWSSD